ncbi:MAG: flagellar hook-basal body complex protein [Gammaproteobacteria bacterium]|nr:flagellar hook-basal body complex protein [Gammaproteobacteria bacterium]
MSFTIGLTGIRAADSDLGVTANNIANASTSGFKRSRAEFGDVYASSIVGTAANSAGSGVALTDVSQQFTQGNISFTDSALDLAINGSGFFILSDNGDPTYTRAGLFSTDNQGYLVNNSGYNLQGFGADDDGNIVNGVLTDLQVRSGNQAPQQTTEVTSRFNLDATEPAPEELVSTTNGSQTQLASNPAAQLTRMTSGFGVATSFATDSLNLSFTIPGFATPAALTVNAASVAAVGNGDATIDNAAELTALLNNYFSGLAAPYNSMTATATGSTIDIDLSGEVAGANTNFTVSMNNVSGNGIAAFAAVAPGVSSGQTSAYQAPDNGYSPGQLDVITATTTRTLDLTTRPGPNATARQVAEYINEQDQVQNLGIAASARTHLRLSSVGGFGTGELAMALKPTDGGGATNFLVLNPAGGIGSIEEQIVAAISNANIPGVSASISSTGIIDITALNGEDIILQNNAAGGGATLDYVGLTNYGGSLGVPATSPGPLTLDPGNEIAMGGELNITVNDGISVAASSTGTPGNIWGTLPGNSSNTFDPLDADSYNSATSVTIYDSLGNSHIMTQYFVKERTDPTNTAATANNWSMYITIDGENVGNPAPGSTVPGLAQYSLKFTNDGTLDPASDGPFLVSNWTPLDDSGNYNGSLRPNTGGVLPIPSPPISSNFEIDIAGTTQFGSDFAVNDVDQDGFATGRLTGLNIEENGIIFARFTNGQAQVLGQLALAGFVNEGGLQSQGNTGWAETFESGPPLVGVPQTAALGLVQSGALEESNVDISEELVNLIIAQRNYQSNAKTIETADQVTQTILNI